MIKAIIKTLVYLAVLVTLAVYTPKFLAKHLHTPYPMAAVTSGSMWPTLKTGDIILMRGVSGSEVEIGQIVIYRNSKGFTIHRLIRKQGGKLITRGDANNVDDEPIMAKDIIGRVIYIGQQPLRIPKLGKLAQMINSSAKFKN